MKTPNKKIINLSVTYRTNQSLVVVVSLREAQGEGLVVVVPLLEAEGEGHLVVGCKKGWGHTDREINAGIRSVCL